MGGKPEIVVVDDDASVSQAVERLLATSGWVTRSFSSAEDFLRWEGSRNAGLLIVDIHLPGISGLDLQEKLAAEGNPARVILITGQDQPHYRERARKAGVLYLTKPFVGSELTGVIRRHLESTDNETSRRST